jgi:hypothetical protein
MMVRSVHITSINGSDGGRVWGGVGPVPKVEMWVG